MDINNKKKEMQKLIDAENGINYHRNVDLSGYTFYKGKSFISFKLVEVNNTTVCLIKYIYLINKNDLIKLLSFCINFWAGNQVKFIYLMEHKRKPTYVKNYFSILGFKLNEQNKPNAFKYHFESTNGFDENDILEAYL